MTDADTARTFFDGYTRALLDRDAAAIAGHYAVPALILFPGQSIVVTQAAQTEDFFAGSFAQYDGVSRAHAELAVLAGTEHSLWVDVTWFHDGAAAERFVYQLVRNAENWAIAVLTPRPL